MLPVIILSVLIAVVSALSLLFILWQAGMSVAAMMKKPVVYTELPPQKFAVLVCARNEEQVIGGLLDSLKNQKYPEDCYEVFVVAHNCTDRTADVARSHGVQVLVRNAPEEKQKSDALRFALNYLQQNRTGAFDCFCVFDADCIARPEFLYELNRGFSLGADVVSGYYASGNFDANLISRLTGTLYHLVMHTTCDAQNRLGLPVNVYGTGFAAKMKWSSEVFALQTMVEDFELTIRLVLRGARLAFAPQAVFYAEMPEDLKTAYAQRRRWTYGDLQCFRLYGSALRRAIPELGFPAVKQYADTLLVPVCVATPVGILSGLVLSWLFGKAGIFLLFLLGVLVIFQVSGTLCAVDALNSRQNRGPLSGNLGAVLLIPLWLGVNIVVSLQAVFCPPPQWKATPHTSQKAIDEME